MRHSLVVASPLNHEPAPLSTSNMGCSATEPVHVFGHLAGRSQQLFPRQTLQALMRKPQTDAAAELVTRTEVKN